MKGITALMPSPCRRMVETHISAFEKKHCGNNRNEGNHCSDAFPIADAWWEHINCTTIGQKYRGLADVFDISPLGFRDRPPLIPGQVFWVSVQLRGGGR